MDIRTEKKDGTLTVSLAGRLDTTTAPALETKLSEEIAGVSELVLEFSGLQYISSAGLRVILGAQKTMNKQGKMKLTGVNEDIMDVFDITGFGLRILISRKIGTVPFLPGKILPVNKFHKGRVIHVSVEKYQAVVKMISAVIGFQKLIIGKIFIIEVRPSDHIGRIFPGVESITDIINSIKVKVCHISRIF